MSLIVKNILFVVLATVGVFYMSRVMNILLYGLTDFLEVVDDSPIVHVAVDVEAVP